jgi:hypothetical protein
MMRTMKRYNEAAYFIVIFGPFAVAILTLIAVAVLLTFGCSPRAHGVAPISSSHSALTASDYDLAETEFSGGLAALPPELQEAADRDCQRLLNKRNTGRAIVYGLGGLTGVGGITTLIPKDVTDEEKRRWDLGLGIATLGTATATTILGALVQSWTDEYERQCVTETPSVADHPASDETETATNDVDGGAE